MKVIHVLVVLPGYALQLPHHQLFKTAENCSVYVFNLHGGSDLVLAVVVEEAGSMEEELYRVV